MIPALIVFGITYVLLLSFQKFRPYIALGSAVVFTFMAGFNGWDVFKAIDWNVLMMIAGTMGTVYLFIESKMPDRLADFIISKVPNVKWATVWLSLFAGIISAFVDNVATVLMIAPVALNIAKKLNINPVAMIISITIGIHMIFSCVPYLPHEFQLVKGRLLKGTLLFLTPCILILWVLYGVF